MSLDLFVVFFQWFCVIPTKLTIWKMAPYLHMKLHESKESPFTIHRSCRSKPFKNEGTHNFLHFPSGKSTSTLPFQAGFPQWHPHFRWWPCLSVTRTLGINWKVPCWNASQKKTRTDLTQRLVKIPSNVMLGCGKDSILKRRGGVLRIRPAAVGTSGHSWRGFGRPNWVCGNGSDAGIKKRW